MRKPGTTHWHLRSGTDGQEKTTSQVLLNGQSVSPAEEQNAHKPRIILTNFEIDGSGVVLWQLSPTTGEIYFVGCNRIAKHWTSDTDQCAQTVWTLAHFNDALIGVHSHVFHIFVYVILSAKWCSKLGCYLCCRLAISIPMHTCITFWFPLTMAYEDAGQVCSHLVHWNLGVMLWGWWAGGLWTTTWCVSNRSTSMPRLKSKSAMPVKYW